MVQPPSPHGSSVSAAKKLSRAEELRRVLRFDLVVYAVVVVVCVLALASLHPAVQLDHALIGALITFVAGAISGLFAYLRYRANGENGDKESDGDVTN
jgi:multisubunit Na+/H+ antiporter MnhF subunit